jgi:AI-2 transport protein TqsA
VTAIRSWVQSTGLFSELPPARELVQTSSLVNMTGRLVGGLGLLLANTLLILLIYVFLLFEAESLPQRLKKAFGDNGNTLRDLSKIASKMKQYLALKALISLGTAIPVWLFLWIMGVDYPVLWALMTFLLNFIPNIGSAIAAIPPALLALIQFGPLTALGVAAFFIAVNTIMGNIVEPRLMGKGLGLSTFVIVVALVFWGWLFGTVGMFLAVPLTIMVQIVLASGPDTRRLAILLGGDPDSDEDLSELISDEPAETSGASS